MKISRQARPLILYLILDTLCIGAGMGVPIFAILIGFAAGWFLPASLPGKPTRKAILGSAFFLGAYTFLIMAALWGPTLTMLWDPGADLANFGIPLILYEPRASFIGWEVLMIAISPFLQVLAVVFGADVRLLIGEERSGRQAPGAGR
jgi:hypothetical protein